MTPPPLSFGTFPKIHPFWKGNASLNQHNSFGWQPVLSQKHLCNWICKGCLIWIQEEDMYSGVFRLRCWASYLGGRSDPSDGHLLLNWWGRRKERGGRGVRTGDGTPHTFLFSTNLFCFCEVFFKAFFLQKCIFWRFTFQIRLHLLDPWLQDIHRIHQDSVVTR